VFDVDADGVTMNGNVKINGGLLINGTVSTGGLAANAATAGTSGYTEASFNITTSWQDAASATLTMTGGAARVDFCALISGRSSTNGAPIQVRLLRNGTVIRESSLSILPGAVTFYNGQVSENPIEITTPVSGSFPIFLVDTAGATGSVTYTVQLKMGSVNFDYAEAAHRQIVVTEFRR
jgi:hypothetical protein